MGSSRGGEDTGIRTCPFRVEVTILQGEYDEEHRYGDYIYFKITIFDGMAFQPCEERYAKECNDVVTTKRLLFLGGFSAGLETVSTD